MHGPEAVRFYTNIKTQQALREIGTYLRDHERQFAGIPINALMAALRLVMPLNVFTFGDTHWLQHSGTAMGTPPLRVTTLPSSSQSSSANFYPTIPTSLYINDTSMIYVGYGSHTPMPPSMHPSGRLSNRKQTPSTESLGSSVPSLTAPTSSTSLSPCRMATFQQPFMRRH